MATKQPPRHQFTIDLEAGFARAHFAHADNERALRRHRRRGHKFQVGDIVVEHRYPNVVCDIIAVSDPSPNEGAWTRHGDHIDYVTSDRLRHATWRQRRQFKQATRQQ